MDKEKQKESNFPQFFVLNLIWLGCQKFMLSSWIVRHLTIEDNSKLSTKVCLNLYQKMHLNQWGMKIQFSFLQFTHQTNFKGEGWYFFIRALWFSKSCGKSSELFWKTNFSLIFFGNQSALFFIFKNKIFTCLENQS